MLRWLGERATPIVLWDVDPSDWARPGAVVIAGRVLMQTRPGTIILMHDGGGDRSQTVAALPLVIEGLLDRGFRFTRAADLLAAAAQYPPTGGDQPIGVANSSTNRLIIINGVGPELKRVLVFP